MSAVLCCLVLCWDVLSCDVVSCCVVLCSRIVMELVCPFRVATPDDGYMDDVLITKSSNALQAVSSVGESWKNYKLCPVCVIYCKRNSFIKKG